MTERLDTEFSINFKYKFEDQINLKVNIKRNQIPKMCNAFDVLIAERGGITSYYPRKPSNNATMCRYEWFMNYEDDPYGIRISTLFIVEDKDINELTFLLSWGSNLKSKVGTSFSEDLLKDIKNEIQSFLSDLNEVINKKPNIIWTLVYYLDLKPGNGIKESINNDIMTIYPTVKHIKKGNLITAIGMHIHAHYKSEAKNKWFYSFNKTVTLLSLFLDSTCKRAIIELPEGFEQPTFEGKDISTEKIYPMEDYTYETGEIFEIKDIFSIVINLMSISSLHNDKKLWQSINAYVAGQEIQNNQPTLSSVAFITSLAAFSKGLKCNGEIICSKCGNLENFHHNLKSEKDSLIEDISKTLQIDSNAEKMKDLENLIKNVYYKQRSAFVHDAILRHSELDKDIKIEILHPTDKKNISKKLEFDEDLRSIQHLARAVLLHKLLPFDRRIQVLIDSMGSDLKIMHPTLFGGHFTFKGTHRLQIKP